MNAADFATAALIIGWSTVAVGLVSVTLLTLWDRYRGRL